MEALSRRFRADHPAIVPLDGGLLRAADGCRLRALSEKWAEAREQGRTAPSLNDIEDADGETHFGVTVGNIPVGSPGFAEAYLRERLGKFGRGFDRATRLLDPARWPHPDIPTRQMLWVLTFNCFQFMGDYWLRHLRPDVTLDFAQGLDESVRDLVSFCIGVDVGQWGEIAHERMCLPVRFRGCGLREAVDRRFGQFLGGFVQSVLPLLDRRDSRNNVLKGRLHVAPILDLFGEGSFDHPLEAPWARLLSSSNQSGNLVSGLRQTWSHLSSSFQGVATRSSWRDESLLLNQDIGRGHPRGRSSPAIGDLRCHSGWNGRARHLGERIAAERNRRHFERWSWDGWSKLGSQFIISPPDHFGFIGNRLFPAVFTSYLGQPCPLVAPIVGRYFGLDGTEVDRWGANLAAASLPGYGWRRLHNHIQSIVHSMMKLAGVVSVKEAVNFLLGKVGEPWMSRYIDHIAPFPNARASTYGIVPDIHAYNYPAGRRCVNDSGAALSGDAIFEVKTYTACPTWYNHNNSRTRPADRRATRMESRALLGHLKRRAPSGGQVIPLVAGWFGEVNKDFEKVIKVLARHAAASDDGLTISPLINTDRKGGAYPIMHRQFRRAIGVAIVRGNAQLKQRRLHFVRATRREAAEAYNAHSSNNRYRPGQGGGSSWYRSHIPEGYAAYQQFRDGHDIGSYNSSAAKTVLAPILAGSVESAVANRAEVQRYFGPAQFAKMEAKLGWNPAARVLAPAFMANATRNVIMCNISFIVTPITYKMYYPQERKSQGSLFWYGVGVNIAGNAVAISQQALWGRALDYAAVNGGRNISYLEVIRSGLQKEGMAAFFTVPRWFSRVLMNAPLQGSLPAFYNNVLPMGEGAVLKAAEWALSSSVGSARQRMPTVQQTTLTIERRDDEAT
ncbi:hypothetical protein ACHAXT_004891 [Thalassiosira profunda]